MGKAGVSLDTVMISIESDAGKAVSNIDKLSTALVGLQNSINGGFGNISRLAAHLTTLRESTKSFSSVSKNIKSLATDLAPLKELANIPNAPGLNSLSKTLKDLPTTFTKINPDVLSNVSRVSEQLSSALTPLADKLSNIASGFSAVQALANKYGVSVSKIYSHSKRATSSTKQLASAFDSVRNTVSKVTGVQKTFLSSGMKQFESLRSKIKQVGLSLIGTRTLFTMLRKAVSEYMDMDDQLTKYTTNVWRAFGAQLAPAIEYAMYLFKQFVRVIYSVVLALTGVDLISRANKKAMASLGKTAKDTLGSLQKFDDLNNVEFDKGSKGKDSGSGLIDLSTIDLTPFQKVIDWVKKVRDEIKKAIDTGEWYNVGKVFAEGVNAGVSYLLSQLPKIEKALNNIAKQFAHALNGFIENVHWGDIGKLVSKSMIAGLNAINTFLKELNWSAVGKALNDYLSGFELTGLVHAVMNVASSLATGLTTAFLQVQWDKVAEKLGDAIISFFSDLSKILQNIPWKQIGQKIHDALVAFPWGDVWYSLTNSFDDAVSGISDFFSGLTGIDSGVLKNVADAFVEIGKAFVTYKLASCVTEFIDAFANGAANINPWLTLIGGLVTIFTDFKKAMKAIKKGDYDKAEEIADRMKKVEVVLVALAIALGGMALWQKFGKKFKKGSADLLSGGDDIASGAKNANGGLTDLFDNLGKAASQLAVLAGIALVLNQLSGFIKAFGDSGLSAQEGFAVIASAFGGIAIGFAAVAAASKLLDTSKILAIVTVFAGLSAVLLSLSVVLNSCAKLGNNLGTAFDGLNTILKTLTVLMVAMVASALLLGSNPLYLIGILAVVTSISAVLLVMKETLPTILNAVGKFITDVAPSVQKILTTIGEQIQGIIKQLGKSLPPIISSIGGLFTSIFNGISKVIKTVGDSISNVMKTADKSIGNVLNNILKFIRELGPAIEKFVDSAIRAVTKLINFVVSSMEYLINTAIVGGINGLISALNNNQIAKKLNWKVVKPLKTVSISRFTPKLATGTNEIPQEGPYYLHKGEAVVPKKYNPAMGGGTNEETNKKLDTLISIMENLSYTNVVNVGNETLYKKQQQFNKQQQNKYGTINL